MTAYKRKTWKEKLEVDRKPEVEKTDKGFAGVKEGQLMLIPTPKLVDAYIRQIPNGSQADTLQIRKGLAAEYHAETTCPLTTGIFLRIVAEAAYEDYQKGKTLSEITPFWRAMDEYSPAAKKLTFGTALLKEQRRKEKLQPFKKTKTKA